MSLPYFYINGFDVSQKNVLLDEDNSRHIIQVLRMKVNDRLHLTDGKGNLFTALIRDDHKKHCMAEIQESIHQQEAALKVVIAISLVKNTNRFEWFLEKATEIGVSEVIPMICSRTEKEKFRIERMRGICISAMLQSQQCWLPEISEPVSFDHIVTADHAGQKFIAYCNDETENAGLLQSRPFTQPTILIGPEGDFTTEETGKAIQKGFIPVNLGRTRLRTETAGIVAATLLMMDA